MGRLTIWFLLGLTLFAVSDHVGFVNADVGPSESECRPYIERAINELKTDGVKDGSGELQSDQPRRNNDDDDDDDDDDDEDATSANDIDGDGIPDDEDDDIDGDGIPNDKDDDIDGDGIPNEDDDDIDGDGVPNEDDDDIDGDGVPNSKDEDIDGDGLNNADDEDIDGDGTVNHEDDDLDGDGTLNHEDNDLDGDGVPNDEDEDMDGDGTVNHEDEDLDGDGVQNEDDDDIDGDGKVNHEDEDLDGDGVKNEKDEDLDGDGKVNIEDEDLDGDGVPNEKDDDLDGDGIPNEHDNDVDGDGVPNEHDDDDSQADDDDDDDDDDKAKVKKRSKREVDAAPVIDIESLPSPAEEFPIEEEIVKEESVEVEAEPEPEPEPEVEAVKEPEPEAEPEPEPVVQEQLVEEQKPVEQAPAEEESAEEVAAVSQQPEAAKEDAIESKEAQDEPQAAVAQEAADADDDDDEEDDTKPEDELLWEGTIPENRRSRQHITELLLLDEEFNAREKATDNVAEIILKDIKRIYENAIKPLETLYKYRDLSNRHFSDPEIFSKPLVLFMGPWSGGKSSILNYLTDNEYTPNSLRTGAEPSPAYFNILMWGNETEVLDGTQLAADYTFSGLQKFGQGLEERLRGLKMKSKLLEKVNIVEIPGILEVRKQVSRVFPFNDACQWFIDRADIIFLVYDPAKLDVGPETEAILDQLKGREYQTRIILNKADTVHPEELLRVQGALIWNISPLMSSAQPPLMYTTSLWTHPYQDGAPARLLLAQERAFLRDLRTAIDKRIEHKIASARRFAVRVRNHAKMVDCYLNTYFNHKTLFGNKKRISDDIIDHPQNYHIYEGLSTLTNISRYDLPDPEVYRDFFRLNPLYEFKKLSETCTYFRGCPINKLDQAISYELPELAGKYKKMSEAALANIESQQQQQQQQQQQHYQSQQQGQQHQQQIHQQPQSQHQQHHSQHQPQQQSHHIEQTQQQQDQNLIENVWHFSLQAIDRLDKWRGSDDKLGFFSLCLRPLIIQEPGIRRNVPELDHRLAMVIHQIIDDAAASITAKENAVLQERANQLLRRQELEQLRADLDRREVELRRQEAMALTLSEHQQRSHSPAGDPRPTRYAEERPHPRHLTPTKLAPNAAPLPAGQCTHFQDNEQNEGGAAAAREGADINYVCPQCEMEASAVTFNSVEFLQGEQAGEQPQDALMDGESLEESTNGINQQW